MQTTINFLIETDSEKSRVLVEHEACSRTEEEEEEEK